MLPSRLSKICRRFAKAPDSRRSLTTIARLTRANLIRVCESPACCAALLSFHIWMLLHVYPRPELVICLGATAAKAMFGPSFRITKQRGQLVPLDQQASLGGDGSLFDEPEDAAVKSAWIMATTHPSAVLRIPEEGRQDAYDALVADLRTGASVLA